MILLAFLTTLDASAGEQWTLRRMVSVGQQLFGPTAPRLDAHWASAGQVYDAAILGARAELDLRSRELPWVEPRPLVVWSPEPTLTYVRDDRVDAQSAYHAKKEACLEAATELAVVDWSLEGVTASPWERGSDSESPLRHDVITLCDEAADSLVAWHEVAKGGTLDDDAWLDPGFQTLAWRIASARAVRSVEQTVELREQNPWVDALDEQVDSFIAARPIEHEWRDGARACVAIGQVAASSVLDRAPRLDAFVELARRLATDMECWGALRRERKVPGFTGLVELASREQHRGVRSTQLASDCWDADGSMCGDENGNDGSAALTD